MSSIPDGSKTANNSILPTPEGENMKLTKPELSVLQLLALRPHGAPVRGDKERAAVLSLADKVLVCDPHEMGSSLFTRITEAGRQALSQDDGE